MDATLYHPVRATWKTPRMLRSNSHFNQLPRHSHATVYHSYVVTSISSNFEDALDVTFQETFQSTSRTLWMLRCTIQFEQLARRLGCYDQQPVQPTSRTLSCYGVPFLRCNIHLEQLRRCFGCYVPTAISINFQHTMDATL